MSEWQPIETAPQDGTEVLLHCAEGDINVAYWDGTWWADTIEGGDVTRRGSGEPTHWMPLPEPPQ